MKEEWDEGFNEESLTEEQKSALEEERQKRENLRWIQESRERDRQRRESMLARGYMDIPHINPDVIRDNFLALANEDTSNMYGDPDILAPWSANRMIWMCHNCGCFGYKQGYINELFKCYNSHCRSRNVTICRAGEMSLLIRNSGTAVGVNMADVYQRRQERLREARRARRSNARRATVSA